MLQEGIEIKWISSHSLFFQIYYAFANSFSTSRPWEGQVRRFKEWGKWENKAEKKLAQNSKGCVWLGRTIHLFRNLVNFDYSFTEIIILKKI